MYAPILKSFLIEEAYKQGFLYHVNSSQPKFFQDYMLDGGLVTISKYPIVRSQFHIYKTPPASHDAFTQKGTLYCKVDLGSIGGSYLHLFTTHTNASHLY
jgi:hypothetical protein